MKRTSSNIDHELNRLLGRHKTPAGDRMDSAIARVGERVRAWRHLAMSDPQPDIVASSRRGMWLRGFLCAAATAGIVLAVMTRWRETDWLATVAAADGSHYTIGPNAVLRPTDENGTFLTLRDGSRVEMRSHSELSLERATDGIGIRLRDGSVIVNAARQDHGHLYVHTKDLTVAVVGTMFVVNAEALGSRVSVIEGEVHVQEGTVEHPKERKLRPGEQLATSPTLAMRSVTEDFRWSRQRDVIAAAFAKGMAETAALPLPSPALAPAGEAPSGQTSSADFEVASIRECDADHLPPAPDAGRGGGANSLEVTPGRLRALCMTTATLIRTAYGYGPVELEFAAPERPRVMNFGSVYGLGMEDGRRVRGGPGWVRSTQYSINAVAAAGVQPDAETLQRRMLQRLLEQRFQLKAHIEAEQIPALGLSVAKGGLKLRPVAAGACEPLIGPTTLSSASGPLGALKPARPFADVRRGERPSCGLSNQRNGPNMVLVGGEVPLKRLAQELGFRLGGVRVFDRTNVNEKFNFILEFALDHNVPGARPRDPAPGEDSADVPAATTIFNALEEQLGLRLESDKTDRKIVVIDHVERPSAN